MGRSVDFEIDLLSQSVIEISSGKVYKTVLNGVSKSFITGILVKDGWLFNWKKEWTKSERILYKMSLARKNLSYLV